MCGIDQSVHTEDRPVNVEHILAGKGREVRTIGPEATVSDTLHRMHDDRVGTLVAGQLTAFLHTNPHKPGPGAPAAGRPCRSARAAAGRPRPTPPGSGRTPPPRR